MVRVALRDAFLPILVPGEIRVIENQKLEERGFVEKRSEIITRKSS